MKVKKIEKSSNGILTQIALGIGDIDSSPYLWEIMDYCRNNNYSEIIPNLTTNGMGVTKEIAQKLAKVCGAVAVSRYNISDICYDTIQNLKEAGLKQSNIHMLFSEENYNNCFKLLKDAESDSRLKDLNAIVFLRLKPKGNRNNHNQVNSLEKFNKLIKTAQDKGISVGMDSCTAPLMLRYTETYNQQEILPSVEPCESTLFSIFANYKGEIFPCSFTEGELNWEKGISLSEIENFTKDVWNSPRINEWRKGLINSSSGCTDCSVQSYCRSCPVFDITPCRNELVNSKKKNNLLNIIE